MSYKVHHNELKLRIKQTHTTRHTESMTVEHRYHVWKVPSALLIKEYL